MSVRSVRVVRLVVAMSLLGGGLAASYMLKPEMLQGEAAESVVIRDNQALIVGIHEQLQARTERFSFRLNGAGFSEAAIKEAIKQAIAADDYTAYVMDSYYYTIRSRASRADLELIVRYRETAAQTAQVDRITDVALRTIVHAGMSDHERVKAIHDWVVDLVAYDTSLQRYTAYEALSSGKAVCQGYALLMHRMLVKAGFEDRIAEGTVQSGDHAWNVVKLGGNWYHLDATWDDAAPDTKSVKDQVLAKSIGSETRYRYYLLTDDQMRADHHWTKPYPKAEVSYASAIVADQKAASASTAASLAKLEAAIGLDWLRPERTADSLASLTSKLADTAARGLLELTVRYTNGESWSNDIRAAIADAGIRDGYSVRSVPYRTEGSVLLHIELIPSAT
ncbi:transglutaminase domain protein [Paenibacillus curdlanolyticus YK9]|uniref:Transglutaminase domain protein n=1 Tax=Paenibacillus curdlanolyticus YK9 TaxID=717606 RepID=E0I7D7_9BACL|nr:transglutaminase domain-containing protein [Paenibacillus curdlanolyticus]EFM11953.1 transglutaminase domain protein [Paenibacillus curdlanolyticus YK9]